MRILQRSCPYRRERASELCTKFGGNLIIWALVGAIAGGFIWSIQVSLFIGILSAIGSIFSLIFKPEEK